MKLSITTVRHPSDLLQLGAVLAQALQFPVERAGAYFESAGPENVRLAWCDAELAGGAVLLPMGQFWGGRSVPMTGIAAVGVAPHRRSQGVGVGLIRGMLQELHAAGCPLATLYPATQPTYRRAGFEVAGTACKLTLPTAALERLIPTTEADAAQDAALEVRRLQPEDEPAVRDLYRAWAADHPGNLDRSEFIWRRVAEFRGTSRTGYVITRSGCLQGYFYYAQKSTGSWPYLLEIADRVLTTPAAARRFLRFMADHRSMANEASWVGPPNDALLLLLREPSWSLASNTYWMLRVVHAAAALESRGWPAGAAGELHLDLRDELLPANAGRWVLSIAEGRARVTAGGRGSLALDVSGLAPLYTGYLPAQQLAALGRLRGPAAEQALATALFAGPIPWMLDAF